jgi:atypical dual specificity phosphatase
MRKCRVSNHPMSSPNGFSWVEPPLLAAMSQPADAEEYAWLREQGVQLLISLCEDAPSRSWLNEAGLFSMHIPVEDMHPPTPKQIELCMSAIDKAHARGIGVGIHCGAGLGRTGTMLACYFVKKGMSASAAIAHVRKVRPGSIETPEQATAVSDYARRLKRQGADG